MSFMRIAMLHLNLSTESGDPRMFFSIAQALKRAGHNVTVFTAQFDPACFSNLHQGLHVVVARSPEKLEAVFEQKGILAKIFDRLEREKRYTGAARAVFGGLSKDLDVLICQNDQSYKLGRLYKKVNPGARVVWIMNNAPWRHTRKSGFVVNALSLLAAQWTKLVIKMKYAKSIDFVVTHDDEQRRLLRGFRMKSAVFPIPIDFENFYLPPKQITSGKHVVLLGIGSLSPARKFEDIIAAAGLARRADRNVSVILICKDFWKNAAYRELLTQTVRDYGLDGRVEFYFQGVTEDELREILRRSHIYVFPNHIKIWSMASFEAMAAGLVLLTSSITSIAEVLRDGENAVFFEAGDTKTLAGKIGELVDDPSRYARIAAAGQKFVRKNLDWDTYIKNFLNFVLPR